MDDGHMFDICEETTLIKVAGNGVKVMTKGKYRLTFTALMKSTSKSPINVEIQRVRNGSIKIIGLTGVNMQAKQGNPHLGISTTIDMIEDLQKDDLIEIKQTDTGNSSYLRSSEWNLLRLEGHMINSPGLSCLIVNNKIRCNEEDHERDNVKITETGLYEVALNGVTFQVSKTGTNYDYLIFCFI